MPDLYTHYLAAKRIAAKHSIPFSPLFQLGCQGGDFGYFYFSLGKNIGSFTHKGDPHAFFSSAAKYCGGCKEVYPYALGYLTHYCLDVAFHPYVNSLARYGYAHTTVERAMDKFFFFFNGKEKYSLPLHLISRGEMEKTANMLSYALERSIDSDSLTFSFKMLEFATEKMLKIISPCKKLPDGEEKKWLLLMRQGEYFFSDVYESFSAACLKGKNLSKEGFIRDFSGKIF